VIGNDARQVGVTRETLYDRTTVMEGWSAQASGIFLPLCACACARVEILSPASELRFAVVIRLANKINLFWNNGRCYSFSFYISAPMLKTTTEDHILLDRFADDIDRYVLNRFCYKRRCVTSSGQTVMVNRQKADLYFRFRPTQNIHWPPDSLVIARIRFATQRVGHGTHLLDFLVQLSGKYEYTTIGIERTHDGENIQNFVGKYGFELFKSSGDWIVSVKTLSERLAAR
jgi:hypothetical protein